MFDWRNGRMFLKVKRAAGKQYFALCESVRRDNKILTKTVRSLGNAEKALSILESDYPNFLERYYEIVVTKDVGTKFYGLCTKDGDFLKVYYSGMHYGLYFCYESYVDADNQRKKYTDPWKYEVKQMSCEMLIYYEKELKKRKILLFADLSS